MLAKLLSKLGLKNNSLWQNKGRITEKISKGRKALNAASGLGLKPRGLTIRACGMIFWAMVVPIITFACELWIMDDEDIKLLEDFQVYAGRRIQRFKHSSPRATSYVGLGWIRLEIFVCVKKMLFVRSIAMLDDTSIYKQVFLHSYRCFDQNKVVSRENRLQSPTFDILKVSEVFDLYDMIGQMLQGTRVFSKKQWRDLVWSKAWGLEKQDWLFRTRLFNSTEYIYATNKEVRPLVWCQLSDISPDMIPQCETMSKLVCRASNLKCDVNQYRNDRINRPYCDLCHDFALEDVEHILMHCTFFEREREIMFTEINNLENLYGTKILTPLVNTCNLHVLLGKAPAGADPEMMLYFFKLIATNIHYMYSIVLKSRGGIG